MSTSREYIDLSIPSHPKYLGLLRTIVREAAGIFAFDEEEKAALMLAVNEGCANIIRHCYRMNDDKKIDVALRILPDRMEVNLRDYGEYKDADKFPAKECVDLEPGGMGITLMRTVMDEVTYRPAGDEGTLLTMVKYRSARSE